MPRFRMPDGEIVEAPYDLPPEQLRAWVKTEVQRRQSGKSKGYGVGGPLAQKVGEFGMGVAKSAGGSIVGLGELVRKGASKLSGGRISDESEAFQEARGAMDPSSGGEELGKKAGDVAQFFLPGGAVRGTSMAARVLRSPVVMEGIRQGAIGSAQTGELEPGAAIAGGGIAGAASKLAKLGPWLKSGSRKQFETIFRPGSKEMKSGLAKASDEVLSDLPFSKVAGKNVEQLTETMGQRYNALQEARRDAIEEASKSGRTVSLKKTYDDLLKLQKDYAISGVDPPPALRKELRSLQELFKAQSGKKRPVPLPIEMADIRRRLVVSKYYKPKGEARPLNLTPEAEAVGRLEGKGIAEAMPGNVRKLGSKAHKYGMFKRAGEEEMIAARTRGGSKEGETGAARSGMRLLIPGAAGAGAIAAGPGGALAGAAAAGGAYGLLKLVRSPRFRSAMAAAGYKTGQKFEAAVRAGRLEEAQQIASRVMGEHLSERNEE